MNQPSITPFFLAAAALVATAGPGLAQATSFPEPEVILYGRVCAGGAGGHCNLLTSGTMTWTIAPPSGPSIVVTTELGAYDDGISYILKIPAEKLVEGTLLSPNTLQASVTNQTHDRSGVMVDGVSYLISFPASSAGNSLIYGEVLRGQIERVDLALDIDNALDSDGDGMPDWWELLYAADGLDPFDPTDADGDIDGDGVTNLQEFLAGTDPNGYDYPTWAAIPSTGLALSERDKTFDKDGDGMINLLEFAVGTNPAKSDSLFHAGILESSIEEISGKRYLTLTFNKPFTRRLGISYHIESSDLTTPGWTRAADGTVVVMEDSATTLKARQASEANDKGFLRLAIDEE